MSVEENKDDKEKFHPPFGEQDLSDDLFAEYLFRVGEGEKIDIAAFLSARGFSDVAVETFKKELSGYETYRQLLQSRTLDGHKVGRYRLIRELGRGGMGRVFLAEDTRENRQVAIKLLASFEPGNLQAQERFRREYETVTKLHHPHIVPMFDAGEADGFRYYTMEYIPGFTLDQVISKIKARDISRIRAEEVAEAVGGKGPLWRGSYIEWVCWVMSAIGEALAHAHRRGIIHRDLKPSNILLSPSGRPYLFDFGLACGTRGTRITQTGEVLGTPIYMAPEQIEGGKIPTDQRTDVYGLGVTLYELLTLKTPFQGETAQEVAHRILLDQAIAPRRLNPAVPAPLEAICLTAMSKDPNRRYPNARAMVQDIRNYISYRPIAARPTGNVERARFFAKRHPAVAAAVFAAVLLTVPTGWIVSRIRSDIAEQKSQEVARLIHRGVQAIELADWPKAEKFFGDALVIQPKSLEALTLRGLVREKGFKDRNGALENCRQALDIQPDNKGTRFLQASLLGEETSLRLMNRNGHPDESAPTSWDYFCEGLCRYVLEGNLEKAEESFSRSLTQDRRHHLSLLMRGCSFQKKEKWFESLIDLTAYTYLEPEDPVGFLHLSKTLEGYGRTKDASLALDQATLMIRNRHQQWNHLDNILDLFLVKNRAMDSVVESASKTSGPATAH